MEPVKLGERGCVWEGGSRAERESSGLVWEGLGGLGFERSQRSERRDAGEWIWPR